MQVHVRVEIPTKLSKDERKIIDELKEIQASKPVKKKGFSLFWAAIALPELHGKSQLVHLFSYIHSSYVVTVMYTSEDFVPHCWVK